MNETAGFCQQMAKSFTTHVAGMAQEDSGQVPPTFYHGASQELDLSTKVYKRESRNPYSVLVDPKACKPHLHEREEQPYSKEDRIVGEAQAVKEDRENSDDLQEEDEEEDEGKGVKLLFLRPAVRKRRVTVGRKRPPKTNDEEENERQKKKEQREENDSVAQRRTRRAASTAAATSFPTSRATRGCRKSIEPPKHKKKAAKEPKAPVQKSKCEEKETLTCEKCPRVFNTRWYLERHMNFTHRRMQICDKCGKKFGLESELSLHQQTNCEKKNIQVGSLTGLPDFPTFCCPVDTLQGGKSFEEDKFPSFSTFNIFSCIVKEIDLHKCGEERE
ncbi:hypothetical protein E2320_022743 [Naja naja]|nr:hypothetical protein E2320_022743 [Naja naja]